MVTAARFTLDTVSLRGIEIFDVGTWNGDPYTDAQLDEMCRNTMTLKAKGLLEPPVKLGHGDKQNLLESEGLPAAGWIDRVYRVGTKVVADLVHVPAKVAELVTAGAYRKVSAEIWPKFGKAPDGQIYGYVLKAIAFLGGEIPAVPTLKDIAKLYGLEDERAVRSYAATQQREVVVFEASVHSDDDDPAETILEELERASDRARARAKGKKGSPRARAILDEALQKVRAILGVSTHSDDIEEHALPTTAKCVNCPHIVTAESGRQPKCALCDCRDHVTASAAPRENAHSFDTTGGEPPWSEVPHSALPADAYAEGTALPHHFQRDGQLYTHAGGVRAALAAIENGTDVSDAARAHLEQHAARLGITKNTEDNMDKEVAKALGLEESATPEQIKAKVGELTAAAGKYAEAEKQLAKFESDRKVAVAKEKVGAAIRARKILPRQEPWATDYAQKDPEGFEAYVKAAPEIFADARGQAGGQSPVVEAGEDPARTLDVLAKARMAQDKTLTYKEALLAVSAENEQIAATYARSAPAARSTN